MSRGPIYDVTSWTPRYLPHSTAVQYCFCADRSIVIRTTILPHPDASLRGTCCVRWQPIRPSLKKTIPLLTYCDFLIIIITVSYSFLDC